MPSAIISDKAEIVATGLAPEAVGKLPLLVMYNDEGREGRRSGSIHAATLSIERLCSTPAPRGTASSSM